ncbi:Uma2 family endonuclease [Leptolyngbya sp. PCC 6406]|uniref:Uma2 family endonuclease n=1 Tax=Leptolyngbya sp. PCC 6406 TaxID=1173264 RepID=UPI0002AC74A0|nr:Uma2 family endonuclease [Leptolyngbya sp. PCC 6406]
MTIAPAPSLLLKDFLQCSSIEDSPAWEFVNGEAVQKPMPGGQHSRLQKRLVQAIENANGGLEALPELRCTFGDRSIVPDIAILPLARVPVSVSGEIVATGIEFAPDWVIEILSPQQQETRVTRNLLHCLRHGSQLGWLVDPLTRIVFVFYPDRLPDEMLGTDPLPVLPGIDLALTAEQVFGWLRVNP